MPRHEAFALHPSTIFCIIAAAFSESHAMPISHTITFLL